MNSEESNSGVNRELALERVGGDLELLQEIAAIFIEDYPKSLTEIGDAIANGDAATVERAAHNLKGSVANFTTGAAVALALALEKMGRAGQLQDAQPTLQSLERALRAVHADLESL